MLLPNVYQPVDPATYSDVFPVAPDPRIREVADLMTEWYQLFIDMCYIDAENVVFPPHKHLPVDTRKAAEIGLHKNVVDLYQMLPYKIGGANWNFGSDDDEFLMWGEALSDLRGPDADWWSAVVDPHYWIADLAERNGKLPDDAATKGFDDELGPYVKPWYAPLSNCGNHGSVIFLDTQTFQLWLVSQDGGVSDPVLAQREHNLPEVTNSYDLRQYPSRPAVEFLSDMISRFRSLRWIPGGMYGPQSEKYGNFKKLYKDCGWPKEFDPIKFNRKREKGGEEYSWWSSSPKEEEKSYRTLERLHDQLINARERVQKQIHLVDANHKLANNMFENVHERRSLEGQRVGAERYLDPMFKWEEGQAERRVQLDHLQSNLEALRTRAGRYAGRAWAGVSDERIRALYEEARKDERLDRLAAELRDPNAEARKQRQWREAKAGAAAAPAKVWEAMAKDYSQWQKADNPDNWSILGSGRTVADLRTVLDEDLTVEEAERRIVFALEKNEDRSWKGQRLWRNDDGNVAEVLQE
ncbi:hypothetical protein F4780DRAFT_771898 [Xylariomycetidae sp. FL0641]|nr:hypothetical protein F4780DRAFT_771898 [Xylariomycetidae sp. FL0641]